MRTSQFLGLDIALGLAHRGSLGAAAAFGYRLGEVGEQHGEPQPQRHRQNEAGRRFAVSAQRLDEQQRRQYAADPHHEHHRVLHLLLRTQFLERVHHGLFDDVALEQGKRNCFGCHVNLSSNVSWVSGFIAYPTNKFCRWLCWLRAKDRAYPPNHVQVFDHRPQRQRRYKVQRTHQQHRADQQPDEHLRMRRHAAHAGGDAFLAASEPASASTGIISQMRPKNIAKPSAVL